MIYGMRSSPEGARVMIKDVFLFMDFEETNLPTKVGKNEFAKH